MDAVTRCPACRARLRAADGWCGQCHADLRPTAAPCVPAADPLDGAADRPRDDAATLAEEWARRLAESERGAGVPGLAWMTRDRAGRAGVAVGAAVAVVVLLIGGTALVGVLL